MIDSDEWLGPFLSTLKEASQPNRPVWPFDLTELARVFAQAADACRLQALRPTLYALRHGGASEDLLRGTRDINGVFRRGRWRSWSSLRRYGKEAKLQGQLARVPEAMIEYGRAFEQRLPEMFAHPGRVPPLPRL